MEYIAEQTGIPVAILMGIAVPIAWRLAVRFHEERTRDDLTPLNGSGKEERLHKSLRPFKDMDEDEA